MNFNTKCFAVHELFRNNDKRSDKNEEPGKQLFISFLAQWLAVEGISKTSSLSQGI